MTSIIKFQALRNEIGVLKLSLCIEPINLPNAHMCACFDY